MAQKKLTLWNRACLLVGMRWKNMSRRMRKEWLNVYPSGRATEFRPFIENVYHRQSLVRQAVGELALPLDLDLVEYRRLQRDNMHQEVRAKRLEAAETLIFTVALFAFGHWLYRYFQVPYSIVWAFVVTFVAMGIMGLPLRIIGLLLDRLPRTGKVIFFGFNVALESAAGIIAYGEIIDDGPVRIIVGHVDGQIGLYLLVHTVLIWAFLVTWRLAVSPIILLAERRRLLRKSTATAVYVLARCIELAQDEKEFMRPGTRRQLIFYTHELARILQHGLWRSMHRHSPLAFSELKKRCIRAGQSIEILCAYLALPERTTRQEYLEKLLRLTDTLLSGRLGELPDDPEQATYMVRSKLALVRRLAVEITVSVAPLAVYLLLRHVHLIPTNAEVPVLTLCVAWLATYGLKAIGRSDPHSSSQFPNVLGIFGSTK